MQTRAADPSAKPCKICGTNADLFGVVDFHKSCIEEKGLKLSLSGVPIYYRRCGACRFVFTDAFDDWTREDFRHHIYNDDYAKIDPDYAEARPEKSAQFIDFALGSGKSGVRLLDYGGGDGALADCLTKKGYQAEAFDPFSQRNQRPAGTANVVTAFEVMEHVAWPRQTLDDMMSLLEPDGILLFSTLLQPPEFEQSGLSWWFVGPRNGHISIFSRAALEKLFAAKNLKLVSLNAHVHIACRDMSAFTTGPLRQLNLTPSAA